MSAIAQYLKGVGKEVSGSDRYFHPNEPNETKGKLFGSVEFKTNYAASVELGAKPHVIEIKNKKVLRSKKGVFFGKKVNYERKVFKNGAIR